MSIINIQHCAAAVAILAALSAVGCTDKAASPTKENAPSGTAADIDPRSKVLGVEHVGTAKETPATTSTAKSTISKEQQSSAMPLPGQANDHSTLSPKASQKSVPTGR